MGDRCDSASELLPGRLSRICGTENLSTLETTILHASRMSTIDDLDYKIKVRIEDVPGYDSQIVLASDATLFVEQYAELGVKSEKDLMGKPVRAFYDGSRLIGLQRR